jgi:hypothetical protein
MAILQGDWPINASTTSGNDLADKLNRLAAGTLTAAGGTLVGPLLLHADPSAALGAATKQYVDAKDVTLQNGIDQAKADAAAAAGTATAANNAVAGKLPLTGGTVSGTLSVQGSLEAAGKHIKLGAWDIVDEPGGVVFRLGGIAKMVLRGDGSLEVVGNITAYANI